jgi:hypothetical protein
MLEDDAPLRPRLDEAKDRLKDALGEACAADVDDADTGELIRVEEVLAIANEAAKEAITVKRRLRAVRRTETVAETPQSLSREVKDADGITWTIFAVHRSAPRGHAPLRAPFQNGWLAFDTRGETRRLAPIPDAWQQLSDHELLDLCTKAEVGRRRRSSGNA